MAEGGSPRKIVDINDVVNRTRNPISNASNAEQFNPVSPIRTRPNPNLAYPIKQKPDKKNPWSKLEPSSMQMSVFFNRVVINQMDVSNGAWVGAFIRNSILVGVQQWNTSQCNNGVCSINISGDDGVINGAQQGDRITFKIHDGNQEYDAFTREDINFNNLSFLIIPELSATTGGVPPGPGNINPVLNPMLDDTGSTTIGPVKRTKRSNPRMGGLGNFGGTSMKKGGKLKRKPRPVRRKGRR